MVVVYRTNQNTRPYYQGERGYLGADGASVTASGMNKKRVKGRTGSDSESDYCSLASGDITTPRLTVRMYGNGKTQSRPQSSKNKETARRQSTIDYAELSKSIDKQRVGDKA